MTRNPKGTAPLLIPGLRLGFCALALWLGACGGGTQDPGDLKPRNLLLVTIDTLRADHLGCYGSQDAATPRLDALADSGLLFEHCISVAPITLPSHASILTGLYPFHHGVRNNGTHHLPPGPATLAEALQRKGFSTGAVVSAIVLDSRHGLDRGFETYDDDLARAEQKVDFLYRETNAEDGVRRAKAWLAQRADERWFLWLHLFDPHAGYHAPEPYASRFAANPYDGEIAYVDAQLGELFDFLRTEQLWQDTLIVATADHGESLGEHGESSHGIFIYDATTRVPLIVSHASLTARRVPGVVSSVDILPTVLALLDVPFTGNLDGRVLTGTGSSSEPDPAAMPAYSESMTPLYGHGWSDLRSLRDAAGRYVRAPRPELYDMSNAILEGENMHDSEPALAQRYAQQLAQLLPAREMDARTGSAADMDPTLRAAMAELGYTWNDAGEENADGSLRPDPKDRIVNLAREQTAKVLAQRGMLAEAERVLRAALVEDPDSLELHSSLSKVLSDRGQPADALEVLLSAVRLPGARAGFHVRIAEIQRLLGAEDWRAPLELAKLLDPKDTLPWTTEGIWAFEDGDEAAALSAYEQALSLDERCATAWMGLGAIEHKAGRLQTAQEKLERALECDPRHTDCWLNLAIVLIARKLPSEAVSALESAAASTDSDARPHLRLGNLHTQAGRLPQAARAYEAAIERDGQLYSAHFNLGLARLQSQQFAEAARAFAAATGIAPERTEGWRRLMGAARQAADHKLALQAAMSLLALDGKNVQALMTAAVACQSLNRSAQARNHLRAALASDPARVRTRAARDPELAALLDGQ